MNLSSEIRGTLSKEIEQKCGITDAAARELAVETIAGTGRLRIGDKIFEVDFNSFNGINNISVVENKVLPRMSYTSMLSLKDSPASPDKIESDRIAKEKRAARADYFERIGNKHLAMIERNG